MRLEGTKIYQRPIAKIYENLTAVLALHLDEKADIANLDHAYLKFEANNRTFDLTFFKMKKDNHCVYLMKMAWSALDRSQSEQTELMEKFDTKRF